MMTNTLHCNRQITCRIRLTSPPRDRAIIYLQRTTALEEHLYCTSRLLEPFIHLLFAYFSDYKHKHKHKMNRLFGAKNTAPKPTLDGAISNVRSPLSYPKFELLEKKAWDKLTGQS